MNDRELNLGLEAIRSERTSYPDVADVRRQVLAIPIERMPRRHGWLSRPTQGLRAVFSATKIVVASIIVALFGGLLLSGVLTQQQGEESRPVVGASPSTRPDAKAIRPVMLPTDIPPGVTSGLLDTPLGPARWVHLSGDRALPDFSVDVLSAVGLGRGEVLARDFDLLVASPDGFAALSGSDSDIWWSPDLVSWSSVAMPEKALGAQLSWTDGTFWLATSEPGSLWRSTDAQDWSEVGLSYPSWDVPGLEWQEVRAGTPVVSGETTIVPLTFMPRDTVSYLGLPEPIDTDTVTRLDSTGREIDPFDDPDYSLARLRKAETEPGIYWPSARDFDYGRVRFEEIEGGLRVIDGDDGTVLTELVGVGMDLIDGWAAERGLVGIRLTAFDGESLSPVDAPMSPWAPTVFFGGEAGFVAYQKDAADDLIRVWHSREGADWVEVEPLGDDADEPSAETFAVLRAGPDRVEALDTDVGRRWTSTDGLTWSADESITWRQDDYERASPSHPWPETQGPVTEDEDTVHTRLASGFLRPPLQVQVDGDEGWTAVDVSGLDVPLPTDWWFVPALSGNTVVFPQQDGPTGQREVWIITFYDVPA